MGTYVVIPARYGSTRFPGKPLCMMAGRPMIEWVYRRASRAKMVNRVLVATDDQRIMDAVANFGGIGVLTTGAYSTGSDRVAGAVADLGLDGDDIVINVQGDQPCLDPRVLDELVEPILADGSVNLVTPIHPITDRRAIANPNNVKVVADANGDALYFSRSPVPFFRDSEPGNYFKHLGVYAFRKSFLDIFTKLPPGKLEQIERLEQLRALEHGYPIRVIESAYDSPEVDTPADAERVAALIEAQADT